MRINNNKGENEEDTMFDWIPPDTTKELAIDYMKALPTEKLPIKGTSGAALRRHLLQKQLPLHDINYKVCDKLTEQEQKQFEKYLESLKKYVGQGKVIKVGHIYYWYMYIVYMYIYILLVCLYIINRSNQDTVMTVIILSFF